MIRLWIYGALAAAIVGLAVFSQTSGPQMPAQDVYSREQFERMVSGKTKREVVFMLGDPGVVQPVTSVTEYYDYSDLKYRPPVAFIVRDETTGMQLKNVTVWFDAMGRENHVGY